MAWKKKPWELCGSLWIGTSSVSACCRPRVLGLMDSLWKIGPSQVSYSPWAAAQLSQSPNLPWETCLCLWVLTSVPEASVQDHFIQRNGAVGWKLAIETESEGDNKEEQHAYPTPSTERRAEKKIQVILMTKSKCRDIQLRCCGLSPTPKILIKPCQDRSRYYI